MRYFLAGFLAFTLSLFYFASSKEKICIEMPWGSKKSRFRVWETYIVSGWSYIQAKDLDEAGDLFEKTDPMIDFNKEKWEYIETRWDTLQEVNQ